MFSDILKDCADAYKKKNKYRYNLLSEIQRLDNLASHDSNNNKIIPDSIKYGTANTNVKCKCIYCQSVFKTENMASHIKKLNFNSFQFIMVCSNCLKICSSSF